MMRELYAPNYEARRLETLLRSEGRCENVVDGRRCPNRIGTLKISHAHNLYFEQLMIHHPNDDPWNPDAEMVAVCASCHMILHRKPDGKGKVPPRKPGYKVIGTDHLLHRLAGVGFSASYTDDCRVIVCTHQCSPFPTRTQLRAAAFAESGMRDAADPGFPNPSSLVPNPSSLTPRPCLIPALKRTPTRGT